jgi:hypothetical protein
MELLGYLNPNSEMLQQLVIDPAWQHQDGPMPQSHDREHNDSIPSAGGGTVLPRAMQVAQPRPRVTFHLTPTQGGWLPRFITRMRSAATTHMNLQIYC